MKERSEESGDRVEEPGLPGESTRPNTRGNSSTRYTVPERKALLRELASSGETMAVFSKRHGVSTATICAWKRGLRAHGEAGLVPRASRRNASGRTGRVRSADERRAAVEAFERSQMRVDDFARTFGVSPWTLRGWIARYRAVGPKSLVPRRAGQQPVMRQRVPVVLHIFGGSPSAAIVARAP